MSNCVRFLHTGEEEQWRLWEVLKARPTPPAAPSTLAIPFMADDSVFLS